MEGTNDTDPLAPKTPGDAKRFITRLQTSESRIAAIKNKVAGKFAQEQATAQVNTLRTNTEALGGNVPDVGAAIRRTQEATNRLTQIADHLNNPSTLLPEASKPLLRPDFSRKTDVDALETKRLSLLKEPANSELQKPPINMQEWREKIANRTTLVPEPVAITPVTSPVLETRSLEKPPTFMTKVMNFFRPRQKAA